MHIHPPRISLATILVCLAASQGMAQQTQSLSTAALPSEREIRNILAERVQALAPKDDGVGIVVGIVGPQGHRVIAYGHPNQGDRRELDGDSVFEIGSVGKLLTALLLTDMVEHGEVALHDPVAKYLPAGVIVPERNGRAITLVDLATHTSGLPFMPDELPVFVSPGQGKNGDAELYRFLARYKLTRDPGTDWDYSNVGYWLLGQALVRRGGGDYRSLVRTRITAPLRMESTAITGTLPPNLRARLAIGHNAVFDPVPAVSALSIYCQMQAAGIDQYSTVNDFLRFLSVAMGYDPSPLGSSLSLMLRERRPLGENEQAIGWVVRGQGHDQLITHDGATWGYNSYVAWDPTSRVGVVVFTNQLANIGDIALHLLRPQMPLEKPTLAKHVEVKLDRAVLDENAGRYQNEDVGTFTVVRDGDWLTLQLPTDWGLPIFRLRPESRSDFFVAELPILVRFQSDSGGRVASVLVTPPRGQQAIPAKRIDQR